MSAGAADPFRDGPLARALRPYLNPDASEAGGVLLAVSGGPDSTALMTAAALLGATVPVHVATVDHGLRPESAAESEAVARAAGRLGLPHHRLLWEEPRPASGVQSAARAARYRLLARCAAEIGAEVVLTGHTQDDQAETVLMRLIAGSGPAGLAGMRTERPLTGRVRLARPFLGIPKAELVAFCDAHGLTYLSDPSNADARYARARLRGLLPRLAEEGLSANRLCRLAERLGRDEDALAQAARDTLDAARDAPPRGGGRTPEEQDGSVLLDGKVLLAQPDAIVLRAVDAALDLVRIDPDAATARRLARLERLVLGGLLPALRRRMALRLTLRGVLVEARPDGTLRLSPAPARRGSAGERQPSRVSLAAGPPDLLGKGEGSAYIDEESADGPRVTPGARTPPGTDR